MSGTRTEKDSLAPIGVPAERLWGAQTERSRRFFRISGERMPLAVIHALALVKRSAARVNASLGLLDAKKAEAIARAADEVLAGRHDEEFPLVVWQTGSGTQSNMNVNEVLANRASEILGGERGPKRLLHPNDDVNLGQSSNDVFPTPMHVAARAARASQEAVLRGLSRRAIGGTAVGTGLNTHAEFSARAAAEIARMAGLPFVPAPNKFAGLAGPAGLLFV